LADEHAGARLLFVGDGEERPALQQLARELGLEHFVRFLGTRDDVPRLLQAADAFLLSSISEGIPLTLIEAMATGLPCVATRVGGVPEVVADRESGLLANAGDSDQLAGHLARLASDVQSGRRIGQAGRNRVLAAYGEQEMHARYRAIYQAMTTGNVASMRKPVKQA
jgi:glycosyltransferase involved in cell wall biosynthesis